MGIEFEKVITDASAVFWAMPSEPWFDGDGYMDHGSVNNAAYHVVGDMSSDKLLELTKEIVTEGLDDDVDLSSVGDCGTNPTLTDILVFSCEQVVARRLKEDSKILSENSRRYDLLTDLG